MSDAPVTGSVPAADDPLDAFSACHVGILAQLQALEGLPGWLAQGAGGQRTALESLASFREVAFSHHQDEEYELFLAVLAAATAGAELERVRSIVDRLTREHRELEAAYDRVQAGLKAVAHGQPERLDAAALATLVERYQAHARFEEAVFLPLSREILGRNSDHLAALGLALHLRHAAPDSP